MCVVRASVRGGGRDKGVGDRDEKEGVGFCVPVKEEGLYDRC